MQNSSGAIPTLSLPRRLLFSVLRLFFKLLYHQLAWTYDWVACLVSLGAWQSWVISVLPYLKGPRILEIGIGPGHLQAALTQKGMTIVGLDESRQMVRIAHRRLEKLGSRPNLLRGEAQALPFADNSFHQVVLTFPAEFILNPSTLAEIQRILIAGGEAIILPLAWLTGRKPWDRAVAWLNRITGEAPDWDEQSLEPLKSAGYTLTWEMIGFPTSKVLLIHLTQGRGK